ncbi:GNAT family N-acetyltransferase [Candidatus Halobonum tyrrellensis]|uniref:GCN5-related N-acetyltransferase n=1 Tax=Candidatus Halobonum tyrrellensis G22 TaxID=1324957 RepID=V4HKJ7_9EURY|nr:GNAT family N-acetyltransferase [Candidatus Halobonum tyrrellensis]ESP88444.1 GCN5-related N-acetyltransferase [Candidatus Halobonum tyrrellensis G22]
MPVRRGTPADEPALRALQSHLREPSPDLLAYGLRAGRVLVSETDAGDAVGYLLPVDGDDVHVAELVVHPDRRREGRARRLLRRALAAADGRVTLLVAPDNAAALSLYRSEGFREAGRRPGFYDDGDALFMARPPDGSGERRPGPE